jgi:hypothetical protein
MLALLQTEVNQRFAELQLAEQQAAVTNDDGAFCLRRGCCPCQALCPLDLQFREARETAAATAAYCDDPAPRSRRSTENP